MSYFVVLGHHAYLANSTISAFSTKNKNDLTFHYNNIEGLIVRLIAPIVLSQAQIMIISNIDIRQKHILLTK